MSVENHKARDAAMRVIAVCEVIAQIVGGGEAHFLDDVQAQWAAEMGLIRIGEAVAKIPAPSVSASPSSPGGRSSTCGTSPPISTTTSTRAASGAH